MKNWCLGVWVAFDDPKNIFSVPWILNRILQYLISHNNIIVPKGEDPLHFIPKKSTLLNLSVDLRVQRLITKIIVITKLKKLATLIDILPANINGYSFHCEFASWAFSMGCPPRLIQIYGWWRSVAYKAYLKYQTKQIAQLTLYTSGVLRFSQAT